MRTHPRWGWATLLRRHRCERWQLSAAQKGASSLPMRAWAMGAQRRGFQAASFYMCEAPQ